MVGRMALDYEMRVRFLLPQPKEIQCSRGSKWIGDRLLICSMGVQVLPAVPNKSNALIAQPDSATAF